MSLFASDLGQLGSADQRVGLLQESPPGALVVIRAVMSLGVAVGGAEVVTTSKREVFTTSDQPSPNDGPRSRYLPVTDLRPMKVNGKYNTINI